MTPRNKRQHVAACPRSRDGRCVRSRRSPLPSRSTRSRATWRAIRRQHIEGYARLCRARGVDVATLASAADIPAVPTDAFKVTRVATFDAERDGRARSARAAPPSARAASMRLRDVSTYDAAAVAFGRHWLARDLDRPGAGRRPRTLAGAGRRLVARPHVRGLRAAFGSRAPRVDHVPRRRRRRARPRHVRRARRDRARARRADADPRDVVRVRALRRCGGQGDASILPRGSRVMQTGGYKGRSREVPARRAPRRSRARVRPRRSRDRRRVRHDRAVEPVLRAHALRRARAARRVRRAAVGACRSRRSRDARARGRRRGGHREDRRSDERRQRRRSAHAGPGTARRSRKFRGFRAPRSRGRAPRRGAARSRSTRSWAGRAPAPSKIEA